MTFLTDLGKNMKVLSRISESLSILNKNHFKEQLKLSLEPDLIQEIVFDEQMHFYDSYGRTSNFHVVVGNRRFVVLQPGQIMFASAVRPNSVLGFKMAISKLRKSLKQKEKENSPA